MYNRSMDISLTEMEVLLEDAIQRDRTTARRAALLAILRQERFLTREQLITRVEGKLGKGCFGEAAWEDTFYRDMQVVKQALRAAGYHPAYSRSPQQAGYYLRNQPETSPELSAILDGSIAEVDPNQLAIFKQLSAAQRFRQGCSISDLTRRVVAHRIHQRNPQLDPDEANCRAVRESA